MDRYDTWTQYYCGLFFLKKTTRSACRFNYNLYFFLLCVSMCEMIANNEIACVIRKSQYCATTVISIYIYTNTEDKSALYQLYRAKFII